MQASIVLGQASWIASGANIANFLPLLWLLTCQETMQLAYREAALAEQDTKKGLITWAGNCNTSFAPCRGQDADQQLGML